MSLTLRTWVRIRVANMAARARARLNTWAVSLHHIEQSARFDLNRTGTLRHARWETCKSCPLLTKFKTCSDCGCFMPVKVDMPAAKCPKGKW